MLGNAKLVMRGGFGVFYDIEDGALNLQFGGQSPFGYVANNFPCFSTTAGQGCLTAQNGSYVADPFQDVYPNLFPYAQKGKIGTFYSPKIPFAYVVTPHFRTPYAYHFNYGFQYQVTGTTMIEGVYVGSLSRKAVGTNETNPANVAAMEQQYAAGGIDAVNPDCTRPLAACDANGISDWSDVYLHESEQRQLIQPSVSAYGRQADESWIPVPGCLHTVEDHRCEFGIPGADVYLF